MASSHKKRTGLRAALIVLLCQMCIRDSKKELEKSVHFMIGRDLYMKSVAQTVIEAHRFYTIAAHTGNVIQAVEGSKDGGTCLLYTSRVHHRLGDYGRNGHLYAPLQYPAHPRGKGVPLWPSRQKVTENSKMCIRDRRSTDPSRRDPLPDCPDPDPLPQ